MSLRTPLGKVLGLGSAKEGAEHWWSQRLTSVGLALLGIWFLVSLTLQPGFSLYQMQQFVAHPFNAVMLIAFSVMMVWHSVLGIQVVVEDYVHSSALKVVTLILNKLVHGVLLVAMILAVIKVVLGDQS